MGLWDKITSVFKKKNDAGPGYVVFKTDGTVVTGEEAQRLMGSPLASVSGSIDYHHGKDSPPYSSEGSSGY